MIAFPFNLKNQLFKIGLKGSKSCGKNSITLFNRIYLEACAEISSSIRQAMTCNIPRLFILSLSTKCSASYFLKALCSINLKKKKNSAFRRF